MITKAIVYILLASIILKETVDCIGVYSKCGQMQLSKT